jgi:SAM-dependent methyltransferase
MTEDKNAAPAGAAEPVYDAFYYENCCGQEEYDRGEAILAFFDRIADKIVRQIAPKTVLDAGCAFGFLVEKLRDRGVEAYGFDISEYAIGKVREDIRPYCWTGSILEPLPRKYDLIVCMEVVEHLERAQTEPAVDNLCRHADDILFTSTPLDYREATHFSVRQPDYWAGLFAERGFYRDMEIDVSFVMPWAMRVRRTGEPGHRVVPGYERRLWELTREIDTLRGEIGHQRDLGDELERVNAHRASVEADQQRLYGENAELRAEVERLRAEAERQQQEIERLLPVERQLSDVLNSRSYGLAQRIARVAAPLRGGDGKARG